MKSSFVKTPSITLRFPRHNSVFKMTFYPSVLDHMLMIYPRYLTFMFSAKYLYSAFIIHNIIYYDKNQNTTK